MTCFITMMLWEKGELIGCAQYAIVRAFRLHALTMNINDVTKNTSLPAEGGITRSGLMQFKYWVGSVRTAEIQTCACFRLTTSLGVEPKISGITRRRHIPILPAARGIGLNLTLDARIVTSYMNMNGWREGF
jgi:hypothetical protein